MDTLAERSYSHDSQFVGRDARLNSIYDKYLYDPRDLTSPDPRLRELARKASKLQHAPRSAPAAASADGMSAAQQRKKRQSAIGFAPGTKGGNAGAAPAHRRDDSGGGAWAGFMMGNGAVSDSDSDSDAEADRRRRPPPQKAAEGSRAVAARSAAAEPDVAAAGQRGSWTSRAAAVGSRPPDSASQNPPTLKLLGLKSLKDGGSPIGHSPAAGDSHFAAQQGAPRSTARTPDFEMIAGAEQRDARRNDERTMSASDYGDEVDARHGSTIDFGRAMQRGADEARPSRGVHLSDDGPAPPASSQKGRPVSPRTALTRQLGLVTPMPEQPASMAASGDYFGGGPPAPMSAGPSAPAGYDSRGPPPGSLDSRAPSSAPPHPRTLLPAPSQGPPPPQGRAPPPAQLRAPPPPQQAMRGPPGDRFGGGAPGVPLQRGMPGPPGPGMRGPPSPLGGPQPPPQAMQRGPPPSYGSDPRGMPSPTGPPGGFDRGLAPPGAMRGPPSPRGPPGPGYGPPRGPPVPPAGFAPQGSRPQQPPPAGFSDSRPPQKGAGNVFRRSMAFFGGDGPGPAPRPPNGKRQSAFRRSMAFITGRPMPEPAPAPRPYEDDDANAPQPRVRGFVEEKPKSRKSIFFGASGMGDEWDVSGRGERFWRRFSLAQQVAAKPDATSAAFRAKVRRRQRMVKCLSFLGLLAIIAGIAIVIVWREGKSKTTDIPGSINRAENGGTYTPPSAGVKTRRDTGLYGLPAFPAPTHAPAAALPDLYDVAMGSKRSVPFGDAAGAALARRQQHRRLEHDAAA